MPHSRKASNPTLMNCIATVWLGVVNPPREGAVRDWRYDEQPAGRHRPAGDPEDARAQPSKRAAA
jgi:hypothetical protein